MLTRSDFLSLNFVKKEDYPGSYQGLRYLLHQEVTEDDKKLKVYIWPEPFGFEATEDEKKESKEFEFSEKGLLEAIDWINENYDKVKNTDWNVW